MPSEAAVQTEQTPMLLTKSRFFIDAFNTAIIDGPLRIYFSDKQEDAALHIYFEIQEALAKEGLQLTTLSSMVKHTFVMMYPSELEFQKVFTATPANPAIPAAIENEWSMDQFGENIIFGLASCEEKEKRKAAGKKVSQLIQTEAAL